MTGESKMLHLEVTSYYLRALRSDHRQTVPTTARNGVGAGPSANCPNNRLQRRWCRTIDKVSQQPLATALGSDHRQTVPTTARNGVGACRRPALPRPPGGPFVNILYYTPAAGKSPQFYYIPYNIFYNFFLFFRLFRTLVRGCTGGRTGWSRCSTPLASIRPRTPVANCRGRNRARVLATAPQGS